MTEADTVASQIEGAIKRGDLRPGEHLPSDRKLALMHGVTRPVISGAIGILQDRNLIRTDEPFGWIVRD